MCSNLQVVDNQLRVLCRMKENVSGMESNMDQLLDTVIISHLLKMGKFSHWDFNEQGSPVLYCRIKPGTRTIMQAVLSAWCKLIPCKERGYVVGRQWSKTNKYPNNYVFKVKQPVWEKSLSF